MPEGTGFLDFLRDFWQQQMPQLLPDPYAPNQRLSASPSAQMLHGGDRRLYLGPPPEMPGAGFGGLWGPADLLAGQNVPPSWQRAAQRVQYPNLSSLGWPYPGFSADLTRSLGAEPRTGSPLLDLLQRAHGDAGNPLSGQRWWNAVQQPVVDWENDWSGYQPDRTRDQWYR